MTSIPLTTTDAFLNGTLILEQPAPGHGYRANVDSILLAQFAAHFAGHACGEQAIVIDLGAGVGTVALAVHVIDGTKRLVLVEKQPALAALAWKNVLHASLGDSATVVCDDVEAWAKRVDTLDSESSRLVVANPPYTPPGSGRPSKDSCVDAAKHGAFEPFLVAANRLLSQPADVACMCYPVSGIVDFLTLVERLGLRVTRIRFVHPSRGKSARIALMEMRGGLGCSVEGVVVEQPVFEVGRGCVAGNCGFS